MVYSLLGVQRGLDQDDVLFLNEQLALKLKKDEERRLEVDKFQQEISEYVHSTDDKEPSLAESMMAAAKLKEKRKREREKKRKRLNVKLISEEKNKRKRNQEDDDLKEPETKKKQKTKKESDASIQIQQGFSLVNY